MSFHHMAAEGRAQNTSQVARRLAPYFRPYVKRIIVLGLLVIVGTLADLVGPYLIGVAVDQFISPDGAAGAAWLNWLLGPNPSRLGGLSLVMSVLAASYAFGWGLSVGQFRIMVRMSQGVLLQLRTEIMRKVQSLSLGFFESHEAGDLMSRLVNDTQVINNMFGEGLLRLVRMALTLVGIVISMISLNWRLALASYAVLPIMIWATVIFSRRVRRAYRETRKTIGEVSAELQENIAGVREVQAFAREEATSSEFQAVNARNRAANVEAETLSSAFMPLLDVLSTVATAIVVGYGGYLFLNYDPPLVSVGLIVAFLTYVRRFYDPIRELANLYGQFQSAVAGAERIFELFDTPPDIEDAPDARALPQVQGRVQYENVSFSYIEGQPVLRDVSFTIQPGETYAIVGPTGAGKSTLINLLLRFYEPDEGTIRIDGHDLCHVTQASLREQIGLVDQDTFLFSGTVMGNLRYGRLDATDEEIYAAAKVANAHTFIERMAQGYATEVGERGAVLSQGNRQLLAITRAVLKNPRILVLDEATSSVDTRTERLIQAALQTLMAGRTSLVIAHRLSTIRNADQILVIGDNSIVERGTHAELLAAKGVYHELYMSQFRRQEEHEGAAAL